MYKLVLYIPESHLEQVKEAVFASGAGKIGRYDRCCWQVLGEGQFRPLPGSKPYVGSALELHREAEYRVELVCENEQVAAAVAAYKEAHPYEEPAYDVWALANL